MVTEERRNLAEDADEGRPPRTKTFWHGLYVLYCSHKTGIFAVTKPTDRRRSVGWRICRSLAANWSSVLRYSDHCWWLLVEAAVKLTYDLPLHIQGGLGMWVRSRQRWRLQIFWGYEGRWAEGRGRVVDAAIPYITSSVCLGAFAVQICFKPYHE